MDRAALEAALAALRPQHPVPAQRLPEAQRKAPVTAIDGPAQRRVDVVLLGGQPTYPDVLLSASQVRVSCLGEPCEVLLLDLTAHAPLFGELAVPPTTYVFAFSVVIALGIRKLFFVICLRLART